MFLGVQHCAVVAGSIVLPAEAFGNFHQSLGSVEPVLMIDEVVLVPLDCPADPDLALLILEQEDGGEFGKGLKILCFQGSGRSNRSIVFGMS